MSLQLRVARASARGDPGLFGDIFKGIKKVAGIGTGVVSKLGIPVVSGVAGTVSGALTGAGTGEAPGGMTVGGQQVGFQRPRGQQGRGFQFNVGGPSGITVGAGTQGFQGEVTASPEELKELGLIKSNGKLCPVGDLVPNKTAYFTRDGVFHPVGSKLVKRRKRNPMNASATRHAITRIKSAKRFARSISNITIREKRTCRR